MEPIRKEHLAVLEPFYRALVSPLADLNEFMMVAWQRALDLHFAVEEGVLFVVARNWQGRPALWGPPLGPKVNLSHIDRAFDILAEFGGTPDAAQILYVWQGYSLWRDLEQAPRFSIERVAKEYLYSTRELAALASGAYATKRQESRRCERIYGPIVKPYSVNYSADCLSLLELWHASRCQKVDKAFQEKFNLEFEVCRAALLDQLPLIGVVAFVKEAPVAFSIGAAHGAKSFNCMFEKTDPRIKGISSFIFHQLAASLWPRFEEIDSGEDWGVPYLTHSKLSWRPTRIQENYAVRCVR